MSEIPPRTSPPVRPPVTDSPWLWLILFVSMALVALVVVGPKFAARQGRLERMSETRDQIARLDADGQQIEEDNDETLVPRAPAAPRRLTLGPLAVGLSLLLALAAVAAGVISYLKSASNRDQRATKSIRQ